MGNQKYIMMLIELLINYMLPEKTKQSLLMTEL